ncbi:hypothetical protein BDZ91DRAFT_759080 [Kalaharituber pfeilii]|nr:hypothetical protein BDZ91DRAFT_759080 [Kalaharituber pfeilii]
MACEDGRTSLWVRWRNGGRSAGAGDGGGLGGIGGGGAVGIDSTVRRLPGEREKQKAERTLHQSAKAYGLPDSGGASGDAQTSIAGMRENHVRAAKAWGHKGTGTLQRCGDASDAFAQQVDALSKSANEGGGHDVGTASGSQTAERRKLEANEESEKEKFERVHPSSRMPAMALGGQQRTVAKVGQRVRSVRTGPAVYEVAATLRIQMQSSLPHARGSTAQRGRPYART